MTDLTRFAAIILTSDTLTPDVITTWVGVNPDKTRQKGTADKRIPEYDLNEWSLQESGDCSVIPPELVHRLIDRTSSVTEILRSLAQENICDIHLSIWVLAKCLCDHEELPGNYFGADFSLDPHVITWLATLNASLSVEFY